MAEANVRKVAVVTGSASGLGLELARGLVNRGWYVAGIDFDARRNDDVARELNQAAAKGNTGGAYRAFDGDVTDETFVNETVREVAALGHIDLLINNAGQPSFKAPADYTGADVDRCLKGLKGMVLFSVATLKATGERDVKIANVMSTAATRGNAHESVYCAAKWGEKGYTKSLQAAYKGTDVKVVGVYPGGIDTDFYRDSRDYVDQAKQSTFMDPRELAEVILFNLVNDANLTVSDLEINRNS